MRLSYTKLGGNRVLHIQPLPRKFHIQPHMSNRVMTYSAGLRKLAQRALALCITLLVLAPYVQAARPMSVEDGGVDDTGTGHVDM